MPWWRTHGLLVLNILKAVVCAVFAVNTAASVRDLFFFCHACWKFQLVPSLFADTLKSSACPVFVLLNTRSTSAWTFCIWFSQAGILVCTVLVYTLQASMCTFFAHFTRWKLLFIPSLFTSWKFQPVSSLLALHIESWSLCCLRHGVKQLPNRAQIKRQQSASLLFRPDLITFCWLSVMTNEQSCHLRTKYAGLLFSRQSVQA